MKIRIKVILLAVACFSSGIAHAIDQFGVAVYPGATLEKSSSDLFAQMAMEGDCYHTADALAKVVEFYKKKSELNLLVVSDESAMFQPNGGSNEGGVDVSIQNPWMNLNTGNIIKDTLVCMVRKKK